jgi:hypothetical protein
VNRQEAIALLIELGTNQLVNPDLVVLEQRNPEQYQLKIKGSYNFKDVELFLKKRFIVEESKNYLIIHSH